MHAPIVGLPGGSSENICPCSASRAFRSSSRRPASTVQVRSPASCSSTWSKRLSERTTSPPSRSIVTRCPPAAACATASAASWTLQTSEALGKAHLLERVGAVGAGHLAAQPRRRHHLARVGEPGRVERAPQPLHRVEVAGPEQERHRARLVDSDPVLAGDRAARLDARVEDRLGQLLGALGLALVALVVEDERMEVPVAGVEDVADPQPELFLQLGDPAQHCRQLRPRDDAVLHVVVRADAAHGRERRLAPLPEQGPLVVVGGDADFARAVLAADALDCLQVLLDLEGHAVELDDQDGARVLGVVRVHRRLGRLDRQPVHHLDCRGQDPRRDDPGDGGARVVRRGESGEQRDDRLRPAQHAQRDLGRDPERPLRPDEDAEQVGAGIARAQLDERAVREDDLRREHVVDGEAVLQAVGPARVFREVAADRADLLAGGVGCVVPAAVGDGLRHVEVGDARLDDDAAARQVDVEDLVHARDGDDDALGDGHRPAGEPRPRAACDERNAVPVAGAEHRLHLVGRLREDDERRDDAISGQPVALVGLQLLGLGDDRPRRQRGLELALKCAVQGQECHSTPMAVTLPTGVEVLAERDETILSTDALAFVADLHRRLDPTRRELLARRAERLAELEAGALPDFLPETKAVRDDPDWRVPPAPPDLQDRRVEITGPTDRKMLINALNSGAKVFMADFEDANSPTWANLVEGQVNLIDAIERRIDFTSPEGKEYRLNDKVATLLVRPRGWHLDERHVEVDGKPISGSLFDFGLYFLHNAERLLKKGSGPYFYLPKLESHIEARLWNDVFSFAQDELGVPRGTIRATVLIETILAAFEMEEILYELRDHSSGLNAGRWDYIFSIIKKFRNRPDFVLPDRAQVTMTVPFMRAYTELLVKTCHKRGAHAMGGMAAFIPSRRDPEVTRVALAKVKEDKDREAGDGVDGTWVAHPDLVSTATDAFDRVLGDRPNQLERQRPEVSVAAPQLLDVRVPGGTITEIGLRMNVSVGIQYIESWLRGVGAAAINNLMEDVATAEISRSQVWQWARHSARLSDGQTVSADLVRQIADDEMAKIRERLGDAGWSKSRFAQARAVFEEVALSSSFPPFLTLVAQKHLD